MAEKVQNEKKISNAGAVAAARGIVKVEPKPSNGFTSKVIDFLEKIAVKLIHDSSHTHTQSSQLSAKISDPLP